MATYNGTIGPFVAGDDFEVRRTIGNIPEGQVLSTAHLTVKTSATQADPGVLQKTVTATDSPGTGHIEDTGGSGTATLRFDLTAANTATLTPGTSYFYDIQVCTDASKTYTPEVGRITTAQGYTDTVC